MRREPEPLLPRTKGSALISGVEGELTLGVDAEGRITAEFVSESPVADSKEWLDTRGLRDIAGTLGDGRAIALRQCALTDWTFALDGESGPRFELELLPKSITIVSSTGSPSRTEFAVVNERVTLRGNLRFDGFDMDVRPADPDAGGHAGLAKGKPSWITHWASVATPDLAAEREAVEVVECLAYTLSLLTMERVVVPLRRVLDAQGEEIRWEFKLTRWPVHSGRSTLYARDVGDALRVVGRSDVRRRFCKLGLKRYVGYLLGAWRDDIFVELRLACVLFALESLGASWFLADGCSPEEVAKRSIIAKLGRINSCLRFIPRKYKSDWLRDDLRNPLVHTGAVPLMTPAQVHEATEELLVLAVDIFFRILGFERPTALG